MAFKFNASNFVQSIVNDGKAALKNAALNTVQQKLGGLGPLGKLAAQFISTTAINDRTITRAIISKDISVSDASDWRVSISVPEILLNGPVLDPLKEGFVLIEA